MLPAPSRARQLLRRLDCDPEHESARILLGGGFSDEDCALALESVAKDRGRKRGARGPRAARLAHFLLDSVRRHGTLDRWREDERGRAA